MKKQFLLFAVILITHVGSSQNKLNIHKFPVPTKNHKHLFYLQRSLNSNTIIYDACFDAQGKLNKDTPVDVYWIRYDEDGRKMPLRFIEKKFAFGVHIEELENSRYDYKITLAGWRKRAIYIKQTGPYKAVAYISINGVNSVLDHIYVESDLNGNIAKVDYIEVYGIAQNEKSDFKERIIL
jgi:hypothetical protein